MDLLTTLKTRLGIIGAESDILLQMCIDDVTAEARSYCNLSDDPLAYDETPAGMEPILLRMAVSAWRSEGYGQQEGMQDVTQVRRGDVSTSFAAPVARLAVLNDVLGQLQRFRKLRW